MTRVMQMLFILIKGKYTKNFFLSIKKENGKLLAIFEIVEKIYSATLLLSESFDFDFARHF